ncbi:MAG TPA: chemotaxis protein CheW [Gemmataceae bacterium]|nr:chemotaxis protein CheW [Gemmataceae bacterium]
MMDGNRRLCTFYLDQLFFGINAEEVQEIIRQQAATPVPLAAPAIRGLVNLRGNIVTAIDLRRRLGMPEGPCPTGQMSLVLRTDAGLVSVGVDRLGDVLTVHEGDFERPPEVVCGPARGQIRGAYKLPDRLVLALDTKQLVQIDA